MRREGLEAEDLDPCAGGFMEFQTRLYHARIIIYKECTRRDVVAYVVEMVLRDLSVPINQQFAMVTFGQRVFGDTLVGQRVIIISDIYGLHFFYLETIRIC